MADSGLLSEVNIKDLNKKRYEFILGQGSNLNQIP
jgi:hypothetical protein